MGFFDIVDAEHDFRSQAKEYLKEGDVLVNELIDDLSYLKNLPPKQYLLHKKYIELKRIVSKEPDIALRNMRGQMMDFDDVEYCMTHDNDIEIILCNGNKSLTKNWLSMRYFTSNAYWQQGTGRNLKYMIMINGKIAGIISLASDVISIGTRDRYIGWDRDQKHKRLGCIGIGSTIVPTQPFGYMCTGGKFLSLMFHSARFKEDWEERYGEKLVGCTTTSLYGQNSQYNGMNKYWKSLGETAGTFVIFPSIRMYEKLRDWNMDMVKYDPEAQKKYNTMFKFVTNSKSKHLNFFFSQTDFRKKYEAVTGSKDLTIGYKRGVYFARMYVNSLEYLQGQIDDNELIVRDNLDFNINKTDEMFAYWKRKWAKRRFDRLTNEGFDEKMKEPLWLSVDNDGVLISKQEFMDKYG